jgi:hypothetical protein
MPQTPMIIKTDNAVWKNLFRRHLGVSGETMGC